MTADVEGTQQIAGFCGLCIARCGTIATVVAAITSVHCALYCVCRPAVATVSTRHVPPLLMTSGHMNEFH